MKRLFLLGGLACVLSFAAPAATNAPPEFGFAGKEVFPVDYYIGLLHAADVDGDGRTDLVLANNGRARINFLLNQTGQTNPPPPRAAQRADINELPPDARFRLESLASEKRIAALAVADFNHDGRPDLAYYGEPRELIVQFNTGSNTWSGPRRWPLADGLLTPNALAAGDLDGNGRADLLLLTEKFIHFLRQTTNGTLAEPEKIPLAAPARALQVLDINADGRPDLLLVDWENSRPFRFRLQDEAGRLGPEFFLSHLPIRSYTAENLVPGEGTKLVTIAQNSGRAQISRFVAAPAPPLTGSLREGQFSVLPLPATEKARRGSLWADVDGDGRADLLFAEPENGRLTFQLQQPDGRLGLAKSFPSLAGVSDIAVADWDGDGRAEIFLLSPEERQVGVTRLDERGRLPFPELLALGGRPLAFAVGPAQPGARPTLAVVIEQGDRRAVVLRTADGATRTHLLAASYKGTPTQLAWHDADHDGLPDLVLLTPYERVKILRQLAGGKWEELDVAPPGGNLEQPWLATFDVDRDGRAELLLPQRNFIRAVVLQRDPAAPAGGTNAPGWSFAVREQINGSTSRSRLTGATLLPDDNGGTLFLLDAELKALTVARRDAVGVWQPAKNILLPLADFTRLAPLALGTHQPNAVALLGVNAAAWQALDGAVWELGELDGYETPIKDGYLHDVVAGDLNGDGRKDLVFLETAKNHLDVVVLDAEQRLVPANRWQVFEQRTYRGTRADQPEPREAVIADVTGDGKNDLVIVVHDRVIVYPQE